MLSSRECTKQLKVFSKVRHYKQLLHAKQQVQGRLTALIVAVRADVEVIIQLAAGVVTVRIGQSVQLQIAAGLQRSGVTVQPAATRLGCVIFSFSCGRGKDTIQRGRVVATVGVRRGAGERHHPDVDAVER